jgi:hypothetical protein
LKLFLQNKHITKAVTSEELEVKNNTKIISCR